MTFCKHFIFSGKTLSFFYDNTELMLKKLVAVVLAAFLLFSLIISITAFGFYQLAQRQPVSPCKNFLQTTLLHLCQNPFMYFYSRHKGSGHYWLEWKIFG